ncbi:MAG: alkaline phosphatase [Acidobacteria bacterium]|nr:alkaline phosphatase [Acidobacteriota bacterium]
MKQIIALSLLFSVASLAAERKAKNVVLFVGDAAGIGVLNIAAIQAGKPQSLFIQRMPQIGLMDTSAATSWVTDSAAGMTAIITGEKTHSGVLSQSVKAVRGKSDGAPLKTLLEHAEERGLVTGVISNDAVSGATPAACYAHSNDRGKAAEIFAQVLKPSFGDGVDVLIGAGRKKLLTPEMESGLRAKNYGVYENAEAIPPDGKRAVVLYEAGDFDLAAAVRRTIDVLSRSKKGFFLMVESDLHTDNLQRGITRTLAFDKIVEETATRLNKDTLVIFTADHSFDTRLRGGRPGEALPMVTPTPAKSAIRVDDGHTGEEVLVAAQGPGSRRVHGYIRNTDLFRIMLAAYGW